jgi:thiamine-monophosphate kinase
VRELETCPAVREYVPYCTRVPSRNHSHEIGRNRLQFDSLADLLGLPTTIDPRIPNPALRILEDELIERIRRRIPSSEGGALRLGIGHDAALIHSGRRDWVVTCDQFLEGVHFLAEKHPAASVGYKALARATSDVVAMGAQPRFFLLSMALPRDRTGAWLSGLLSGMARASRAFGLRLAGGDTARAVGKEARIVINLMVLGEAPGRGVPGRAGAKPGHRIFVTGILGRAQLGLELLLRGLAGRRNRGLLTAHYYPVLPLDLGLWLGRNHLPSAMMDISDGLSTDLARLCAASGVGARIYADRIPAMTVPRSLPRGIAATPLTLALHGGEDYGLLFTVPRRMLRRIPRNFGRTRITSIGEIVPGSKVRIVGADGKASTLAPGGWDHFAKN